MRSTRACASSACRWRADFSLDRDAMLAAIERERPALTFLAYPNNPTGNLFAADDVEAIIARGAGPGRRRRGLLRVRRCELPAARRASSRTCWSCARCRRSAWPACGWATRSPRPSGSREFNKLRQPYNVNALTQAAVGAPCSPTPAGSAEQAAAIRAERARLEPRSLAQLPGVTVYPTQTNFVLVRVADADAIFDGLKATPHPGQESPRLASAAGELPAHHGRYAAAKTTAAVAALLN